jgi:N-acetyl-1-D-myo-inositol-2-amino-2-deoxy-alpha-D-glucopyranoside deacetylase
MALILPPGRATTARQLVSLGVSTPETGGGLLLVHAHPDDESIETGATMARYAAAGVPVTLVTCTLGELGEIIPPDLAYLGAGRGELLGKYRIGELDAACAALGVRDHRFLGGPGRWRDSGMIGLPSNDDPGSFWQADLDEAALDLVAIIREVRPRVMVSYDDRGFYGHPDHVQAHRVAWRAFELAGNPALSVPRGGAVPGVGTLPGGGPVPGGRAVAVGGMAIGGGVAAGVGAVPGGRAVPGGGPGGSADPAPWRVAKFYATAVPRSVLAAATDLSARNGVAAPDGFIAEADADTTPFGAADDEVTTEIDGSAYLGAKTAAMRAHATQITVREPFFALSNWVGQRILAREYYTLLAGPRGPSGPGGRETDLFAGLD